MGADGHIDIWRAQEVEAAFPDAEELFSHMMGCYKHALDNTLYYCGYWESGTGGMMNWDDNYMPNTPRLKEFIDWLHAHKDAEWEVWT